MRNPFLKLLAAIGLALVFPTTIVCLIFFPIITACILVPIGFFFVVGAIYDDL